MKYYVYVNSYDYVNSNDYVISGRFLPQRYLPFLEEEGHMQKEDDAEKSGLKEKWIQKTSSCSDRKKEINFNQNFA